MKKQLLSVFLADSLILVLCSQAVRAQGNPLKLGQVTSFVPISPCPAGAGGSHPLSVAVCYTATVADCSDYTFSPPVIPPLNATVAVSTPLNWNGSTIFLHNGSSGTEYFSQGQSGLSYAQDYYNNGFQVVQVAWASDWHDNPGAAVKVMKYEACRPATLMNYVYTNIHGGPNAKGVMCAQGHSAGSGAMAYALAWYGAGNYLADVVLTSGPVYANIEAGCQYPAAQKYKNPITVCPTTQFGCQDGTLGSWTDFVQYTTGKGGAAQAVAGYTNTPSGNCNNYTGSGQNTNNYNQDWGGTSVVSAGASYSYPKTRLYAFLCATGQSQNNSAGQGQLFYTNFTGPGQTLDYKVYRVDSCGGDEEIWFGTTADGNAFTISSDDMINGCVSSAVR